MRLEEQHHKKLLIFFLTYKWNQKNICGGEAHIDKNTFHNNKSSVNINEIGINKIIFFNKTSYGNKGSFKHYIGYRHKDGTLSPLNVKTFSANRIC